MGQQGNILAGPKIYQKGEGIGKFLRSTMLGYYPEGKLLWFMLIIALGGMAFLVMEESLMGSALAGGLAESLNTDTKTLSWVLGSMSLGAVAGFPLAGPLADKLGRRKLVLFGLAGYMVCDIFQMLCINIPTFVIARALSGAVGMFTIVPTLAMVRDLTPRVSRGMGYGFSVGLGWGGGALLSMAIGGAALAFYKGRAVLGMMGDWRGVFWWAFWGALIVLIIEFLFLKDLHPVLRLRQRGVALESEDEIKDIKESDIDSQGSIKDAISMYFKSWRMWFIWSNQFFTCMPWTAILVFLPTILKDFLGMEGSEATFMSIVLYCGYIACALFAGWFIDYFHTRKLASVIFLSMLGIGFIILGIMYRNDIQNMVLLVIVLCMAGAGIGASTPSFNCILAGEAERENPAGVASAFAFYIATTSVLNFVPQFACPRMVEFFGGWSETLIILGIVGICGIPTLIIGGRGPFKPRRVLPKEMEKDYY